MRFIFITLLIVSVVAYSPLSPAHEVEHHAILRLADGSKISMDQMVEDLERVQLVFVGERHDRASHHEAQLAVIRALNEAGSPVAVGLEMFRRDSQQDLDRWTAGGLTEDAFVDVYYENWSSHWPLYRDIFLYARKHALPMVGLNISPEITRQVATQGFASLTPEQTEALPAVTCNVDATYMAFIRRAFGLPGHDTRQRFVHFCEAQMVWDTAMASNLLRFLEKHPDTRIVVVAGSGHAWKRGIPEQIRKQSDVSYRVVLPEVSEHGEAERVTLEDADYLWLGL